MFTETKQVMYRQALASSAGSSVTASDVNIVRYIDVLTRRHSHRSLSQVSLSALRVTSEIVVANFADAQILSSLIEASVSTGGFVASLQSSGLSEVTHSGIVSVDVEATPLVAQTPTLVSINGTSVQRTAAVTSNPSSDITFASLLAQSPFSSFSVTGLSTCGTWCDSECSTWPMKKCESKPLSCECSHADEFIPIKVLVGLVALGMLIAICYCLCCKKKPKGVREVNLQPMQH